MGFEISRPPILSRRADFVLVGTALIGGVIGVIVGYAEFWFMDFWLGAVATYPVGFLLGIAREYRDGHASEWPARRIVNAAVPMVFIFGFSLIVIIPMIATARANVRMLSTLPSDSVDNIEVYTGWRRKHLATINDPVALADFIRAARDTRLMWGGQRSGTDMEW